jgi:hypothetical protein
MTLSTLTSHLTRGDPPPQHRRRMSNDRTARDRLCGRRSSGRTARRVVDGDRRQRQHVAALADPAHASEHGLQFQDVTFPSRDGTPLEGWFVPAEGSDTVVIINHPRCSVARGFRPSAHLGLRLAPTQATISKSTSSRTSRFCMPPAARPRIRSAQLRSPRRRQRRIDYGRQLRVTRRHWLYVRCPVPAGPARREDRAVQSMPGNQRHLARNGMSTADVRARSVPRRVPAAVPRMMLEQG